MMAFAFGVLVIGFTVATMVGALVLARAVDDPRLSDALRKAALKHLALTQN
mgnify:CR=1 FL=1